MIRTKTFNQTVYLVILLSLFFCHVSAFGATPLFSQVPVSFSAPEGDDGPAKHVVSVNVDLLVNAKPNEKIMAVLEDNTPIVFTLKKVKKEQDKLIWTGSVDAAYGKGKVFFFIKKGRLYGYIEVDGKKYEIAPFQGTPYYSVQDKNQLRAVGSPDDALAPALPSDSSEPPLAYSTPSSSDAQTTIDLLMLYTPEMAQAYGNDLEVRLEYIVAVANQAYSDSKINLKLRIVGMIEVDYDNDNNIYTALQDLTNGAGAFSNVPQLRNKYGADLVTFVRKFKSNKSYCGLAWLLQSLNSSANQGYGFSVIEDGSDNGYYCHNSTLAHELGHNMGCAHDSDHASSSGIFSYSYGYDEPGVFATIMSYDSPRINYFSNPNIQVDGHTIGVADKADNARTIQQTKDVVAAYRQAVTQTYDGPWLSGSVLVNSSWKSVDLGQNVEGAAIFVGPPTSNDASPGVIRLQNVGQSSFQLRFQEWQYEDGNHGSESVDYVEIPLGRHEMSDGSIWEVVNFQVSGTGQWVRKYFSSSMPSTPAVFCSMQTYNGYQTALVRVKNVTTSGFDAAIFEEQALMDGHAAETVACLAVYSSSGSGTVTVNGADTSYEIQVQNINSTFKSVSGHQLKMEEEQSYDSETDHINEVVNILFLGDKMLAQDVSFNGSDTAAVRQGPDNTVTNNDTSSSNNWYDDESWIEVGNVTVGSSWKTVTLSKTFSDPVVIVGPPTINGVQPCVIRVRNVQSNSFEIRVQEWEYLDGYHTNENVSYMVLEAGSHSLPDGSIWQIGKFDISGTLSWKNVNFASAFASTPVVFQTMQTFNGSQTAVMREKSVTGDSFSAAIEEEEQFNDGHVTETVGYLAVEQSAPSGTTVMTMECNHEFKSASSIGKEFRLEEETSKDSETYHTYEQLGILSLGGDYIYTQIETFNGADTVSVRMR